MQDSLVDKAAFCKKYSISDSGFSKANIKWDTLVNIYNDYSDFCRKIGGTELAYVTAISKIPKVHSVRWRIKDGEHLVEKIIRKKMSKPDIDINQENYKGFIRDILGVRALHLYKESFKTIHEIIMNYYGDRLLEKPIVYFRDGDDTHFYKELDCDLKKHSRGYRSVHYVIHDRNNDYGVELQVRTIFEEGWSEIDHDITYPYDLNNKTLNLYLSMFNRFAGAADEMGSFVRCIRAELADINSQLLKHKVLVQRKDEEIAALKDEVSRTVTNTEDAEKLKKQLDKLNKLVSVSFESFFPQETVEYINGCKVFHFQSKGPKLSDYIQSISPIYEKKKK